VPLTVSYEGLVLDCAYRMDLVVEDLVVAELKCIEEVLPIHRAQLLTYLRLSGKPLGLLINFNVAHLRNGVTRVIC
jgi:GxxExxY protein